MRRPLSVIPWRVIARISSCAKLGVQPDAGRSLGMAALRFSSRRRARISVFDAMVFAAVPVRRCSPQCRPAMLRQMTTDLNPARGWVARLAEDNPHRDRWSDLLTAGFDPWLEDIPAGDVT